MDARKRRLRNRFMTLMIDIEVKATTNPALNRTPKQRRSACCLRAGGRERSASVSHLLLPQEYHSPMQVTTGTVIGGKVVVEGVPLVEGSVVAVLSREPEEPFTLSPEDEDELLAAMAEIERGEFVSADKLLESLRKYG